MKGHIRKRGNTWTYVVDIGRDPATGKRRQKSASGFRTKKDAQHALLELQNSLQRGDYRDAKKILFHQLVDQWITSQESCYKPSTFRTYASTLRNNIMPHFQQAVVSQLTPNDVQQFYKGRLDQGLSPKYIKLMHNILRAVFKQAFLWNYCHRNIMEQVTPPKEERKEMNVWTLDQCQTFLEASKPYTVYHLFFVLAIWTGMRRGEIYGLRWKDIDRDKQQLTVHQARAETAHGDVWQSPKTKQSRRTIQLPDHVMQEIKDHERMMKERLLQYGHTMNENDPVLVSRNNEPARMRTAYDLLQKLTARTGLPKIRVHDLRHTHATISLGLGEHPKLVSDRLGHTSISTTLDLYSHSDVDMQRKSATLFEQAMQDQNKKSR